MTDVAAPGLPPLPEVDIQLLDDVLRRLYPSPDVEMKRILVTHHAIGHMLLRMRDVGVDQPTAIRTVVSVALDFMLRSIAPQEAAGILRSIADTLDASPAPH